MEPRKQLLPTIRPKSHSVNLLEYTNGRLMATWFAGSREGSEDQVAVASMLEPSKKEWSDLSNNYDIFINGGTTAFLF